MSAATEATASPPAHRARKLGAGVGAMLLVGAAVWLLWSARQSSVETSLLFTAEGAWTANPSGRELAWKELLATEGVILRSHSLCETAIADARRAHLPSARGADAGSSPAQLCDELEVERLPSSTVLRLRYRSKDAALAIRLVDSLAQHYVERASLRTQPASPVRSGEAEIAIKAEGLTVSEREVNEFAREHSLLTYDSQSALAALVPLREELVRTRIHAVEVQARAVQLEAALQAKNYLAGALGDDPALQAARAAMRELEQQRAIALADPTQHGLVAQLDGKIAGLSPELDKLALDVLARVRAELALARDEERRLAALLKEEEQTIAQREFDLIELRRRQRALAIRDRVYQGSLNDEGVEPAARRWSVRIEDRAHVAGHTLSLPAVVLAAAALAGALAVLRWLARFRLNAS